MPAPPPERLTFADDGRFPNSAQPVVLHRAVEAPGADAADRLTARFAAHGWSGGWVAGIYEFEHYHSTAHEVLGVAAGTARVRLGGPGGDVVDIAPGDVVAIPAGVAHRCLEESRLRVVGAYAGGRTPDLLRGEPGERPAADARIAAVPPPDADPVTGAAWEAPNGSGRG